jgi:hypothetical protein
MARGPVGGTVTGQDQSGEGASCRAWVPCMSSVPSRRRPRAAAPGCRPGVPLITGSSLRAVPAAACSGARGGCWLRRTAAPAALVAELGGAIPGSARRSRRTERPPGGQPPSHRARQMAAPAVAALPTVPRPQAAQPTVSWPGLPRNTCSLPTMRWRLMASSQRVKGAERPCVLPGYRSGWIRRARPRRRRVRAVRSGRDCCIRASRGAARRVP